MSFLKYVAKMLRNRTIFTGLIASFLGVVSVFFLLTSSAQATSLQLVDVDFDSLADGGVTEAQINADTTGGTWELFNLVSGSVWTNYISADGGAQGDKALTCNEPNLTINYTNAWSLNFDTGISLADLGEGYLQLSAVVGIKTDSGYGRYLRWYIRDGDTSLLYIHYQDGGVKTYGTNNNYVNIGNLYAHNNSFNPWDSTSTKAYPLTFKIYSSGKTVIDWDGNVVTNYIDSDGTVNRINIGGGGGNDTGWHLGSFVASIPSFIDWGATSVSNITPTSAVAYAELDVVSTNETTADVKFYWGLSDQGTNHTGWLGTNDLGSTTEGLVSSTAFMELDTNTVYFYRFYATNSTMAEDGWTGTNWFKTMGEPEVDNGSGATPAVGYATLNGDLTIGSLANIYVYWGATDGGSNKTSWANTNVLGFLSEGAFSTNTTSDLTFGVQYYYRCYATNAIGDDWADSTALFTTADPGASLINDVATGLTGTSAVFNATLDSSSSVFDVYVYWGGTNGSTTNANWAHNNFIGSYTNQASVSLAFTNVLLATNTTYYYAFLATNAATNVWAEPSETLYTGPVTVDATDDAGNELGPDNGTFTLYRVDGSTTQPLTVSYTMSGTAANGLDYTNLSGTAIIPAGSTNVDITVTPIPDVFLGETSETVILNISDTGRYLVGSPSSDTMSIINNSTNGLVYVDGTLGTGSNDGTSWTDAYQSLTNALEQETSGSVFWIVGTTYSLPADSSKYFNVTDDRLVGGFAGGETLETQRDWTNNATILDGSIAGQRIMRKTGSGTAVLDGLTIRDGDATGNGGAVECTSGDIWIYNCTFTNNTANDQAGAVWIDGVNTPSPKFVNCTFISNSVVNNDGGAIYFEAGVDSPVISNCTFIGNSNGNGGDDRGGAIKCNDGGVLTIVDCVFTNNSSFDEGGAIAVEGDAGGMRLDVRNTDFLDNSGQRGGGIFIRAYGNGTNVFSNCVFRANTTTQEGGAIRTEESGALSFHNCAVVTNEATTRGGAFYLHMRDNEDIEFVNCGFTNNVATTDDGGAIRIENESTDVDVLIDTCTFNGNVAGDNSDDRGGAIYGQDGGQMTIIDSLFTNNVAGDEGGAICLDGQQNGLTPSIYNTKFYNNTSGDGGAVYSDAYSRGAVVISNCWFEGNNATARNDRDGGAMILYNCEGFTLIDCQFLNNSAYNEGGHCVLQVRPGYTGIVANVGFTNGTSINADGGAIEIQNYRGDCDYIFTNCNFVNCSAGTAGDDRGGAINGIEGGTLTVVDCLFTNCTAGDEGGVICLYGNDYGLSLELLNSDLYDGTSDTGRGGAIYLETWGNGENIFSNVTFNGHTAQSHGGALFINRTDGTRFVDCDFIDNRSNNEDGGAIRYENNTSLGDSLITNCTFSGNSCGNDNNDYGGAIYAADGQTLTIYDTVFTNNSAYYRGGAISIHDGDASGMALHLERVDFIDNSCPNQGGAVWTDSDSLLAMTNCLFAGNESTGSDGGAIYIEASTSTDCYFDNCTFYTNTANNGGAIYLREGILHIDNSIFYDNNASSSGDEIYGDNGDTLNMGYCNVDQTKVANIATINYGAGMLNTNPLFVSASDHHLQSLDGHYNPTGWVTDASYSPCIDAGDPAAAFANEPGHNGMRLNMGRYGNTAEASQHAVLRIANRLASGLTTNSVTLNGELVATNAIPTTTYIFYGTSNEGTNKTWQYSVTNLNATQGTFSNTLAVAQGTFYYWRCYASNSVSEHWATNTLNFKTYSAPEVDNGTGATSYAGYATLRGDLTDGGQADITIYWGTTDGGTTASAWQNTNSLGLLNEGIFTNNTTTNLIYGKTYYYRTYATNLVDEDWADTTASFITIPETDTPDPSLLVGWYAADDIDGDGDTGDNPENGTPISTWFDKTGLGDGRDAVREGSTDPLYNTSGPNGLPAVNFTEDYLSTTFNFDPYTRYTIFTIARYTGGDSERVISSASRDWMFGFNQSKDETWYAQGWIHNAGTAHTNWTLHAGHITDDSNPKATFYKNGAALTTDNTGSGGNNHMIGRLGLGGYRNNNQESKCEIAEVLIYNDVLTSNELNYVGGWLAWKYGLTTTYPSHFTLGIANSDATDITAVTATGNGTLKAENAVFDVYIYWGTNDGVNVENDWGHTNFVGSFTNTASTNISQIIGPLSQGTDYYYRFQAKNSATNMWADESMAFATLAAPTANNGPGAIPGINYAGLRGGQVNGGQANLTFYWGLADGGTTASAWENTNSLGLQNEGIITNNTSTNLIYGKTYYYRTYAINLVDEDWADATVSFTTLDPGVSIDNELASGLTTTSGTFNASLNATSAVLDVTLYWGATDGGAAEGSWAYTNFIGSYTNDPSATPSFSTNGMLEGQSYYYTFRAQNQLTDLWATPSMPFATITQPGVNNGLGPLPSIGYATLRGNLTNGSLANATIYWGTSDGGTTKSSWQNALGLNEVDEGSFTANTSTNLFYGITYYYRCYVSNIVGEAWADSTEIFSTLPSPTPVSIVNDPATDLTSPGATFNATLEAPEAVFDVYLYWGNSDGKTTATDWGNTNFVGSYTNLASASIAFSTNDLVPDTLHFFTFYASNSLTSIWATPSENFISYYLTEDRIIDFEDWTRETGVGIYSNAGHVANHAFILEGGGRGWLGIPNPPGSTLSGWLDDLAGTSDPYLQTKFLTGGVGNITFGMSHYDEVSKTYSVESSTNGINWKTNAVLAHNGSSATWYTNSVGINTFKDVYVKIHYIGGDFADNHYLVLDNITLTQTPEFIGVTNFITDPNPPMINGETTVGLTVFPQSITPTASNITVDIIYSDDEGVTFITNTMNVNSDTNFTYTFPPTDKPGLEVEYYYSIHYEVAGEIPPDQIVVSDDHDNFSYTYEAQMTSMRVQDFDDWTQQITFGNYSEEGWTVNDMAVAQGGGRGTWADLSAASEPHAAWMEDISSTNINPYVLSPKVTNGIGTVYFAQRSRLESSQLYVLETSPNGSIWVEQRIFTNSGSLNTSWKTNQYTVNSYADSYLRIRKISDVSVGQYLGIDNIIISHPPAEAQISAPYYAPAYPATNDDVYVYCTMVSLHEYSPAIHLSPKIVSKSQKFNIWQTNTMSILGGNIYRGKVDPGHPFGEVSYYIRGDYDGYYYTHENGNSENIAPTFYPSGSPTNTLSYTTRYLKSDFYQAFVEANVGTFEMHLADDHIWQGVVYNNNSNEISFTMEGHDWRQNYSKDGPSDIVFGDPDQWSDTVPIEGDVTFFLNEITFNADTNTEYLVILNLMNNKYTVQRCVWQDFDDWSIHPELFATGARGRDATTWETNFNGWAVDGISDFQDFSSAEWELYTNYNTTTPFRWTADGGWRIKHAKVNDEIVQLKETPYQGTIYKTRFFRTDGAGEISFDYRAPDTNIYPVFYTGDISTWTDDYRIRFTADFGPATNLFDENAYASCYYMYQDPDNYYEVRMGAVTNSGQLQLAYSIWEMTGGTLHKRGGPYTKDYSEGSHTWYMYMSPQAPNVVHEFKNHNGDYAINWTDTSPLSGPGTVAFVAKDMDFSVLTNDCIIFKGSESNGILFAATNGWDDWTTSTNGAWQVNTNNGNMVRKGYFASDAIGPAYPLGLAVGIADVVTDDDAEVIENWSVTNNIVVTNMFWKHAVIQVQTSKTVFLPIQHTYGDGSIMIDNINMTDWHGTNIQTNGWVTEAGWTTTNDFGGDTNGRSIDLQMSRKLQTEEQYIISPLLDTIGIIDFMYQTPNGKPMSFELQIAENVPSDWTTLVTHTNVPDTNGWNVFAWQINTNIYGYLRILHTSPNQDAWLRIDDVKIYDHQEVTTNAWLGYNMLSTSLTNGLADHNQLFRRKGRTGHLNYEPDADTFNGDYYGSYEPFIRSTYLKNGIGGISFWYKNFATTNSDHVGNIKVQTSDHSDGPWTTLAQIDTVSDTFQHYSRSMFDRDSRYVRIINDNLDSVPDRISIDELLITDPFGTDLTIQNMQLIPAIPLHADEVKLRIELTEFLFGVTNLAVTAYYRPTEIAWGVWGTNGTALPMTCIETNTSTNTPIYIYETIGSIPTSTNTTDTVIQYFIHVSYDGDRFAEESSPKTFKEFTNPSWYYPVDLNTNNPGYEIPYYVVFSCPPGSVWINEFNLGHFGSWTWDNEFIELAGAANSDIANWRLEIVNDVPALEALYMITNNTTLANEENGFGFWVIGDTNRIGDDMNLTTVPSFQFDAAQHIPYAGAFHLIRSMGAYEHRLSYGVLASWTNGYDSVGFDPFGTFGGYEGTAQLYGTGSNRSDFAWEFATNSVTDNAINLNQTLEAAAAIVEVMITDFWMTSTDVWITFTAPTNVTPTTWSATNLLDAQPWSAVPGTSYTNSDNVYTQWFSLPADQPAYFYKVTVTN